MATKREGAVSTKAQELTSAWIFRRALNDNKRYKDADDILNDILASSSIIRFYKSRYIFEFIFILKK